LFPMSRILEQSPDPTIDSPGNVEEAKLPFGFYGRNATWLL